MELGAKSLTWANSVAQIFALSMDALGLDYCSEPNLSFSFFFLSSKA